MQAVGKIGSYIGRSVYTVSGPFRPYGGAVDIIVVEQPDGTYKSSPWYVRFGKVQGGFKANENVVSISVNGVEADFHMYLDHKGEAFFFKEVDLEEEEWACSPLSSSDDSAGNERKAVAGVMTRTNSRRAQLLGLVLGRKSRKKEIVEGEENQVFVRTESLERAELAADLLELKWSTNLASSTLRKDNSSRFSAVDVPKDEVNESSPAESCACDETGVISEKSNQELENTVEENGAEVKCLNSDYMAEVDTSIESMKEHADLSHSETLLSYDLGLAASDFHGSSLTVVSETSNRDSELQESVEKPNSLSDNNFPEAENGRDAVGSVPCVEQRIGSLGHVGCEEPCVYTEPLQRISLKSKPEIAVEHVQEALNIQECVRNGDQLSFLHEETVSVTGGTAYGTSESCATECISQSVSVHRSNDSLKAVDSQSVAITSASVHQPNDSTCSSLEQQNVFGNLDDCGFSDPKHQMFSGAYHEQHKTDSSVSSIVTDGISECIEAKCFSVFSLDHSVIDDYMNAVNPPRRRSKSISNDGSISETGHSRPKELIRMVRSLPSMGSVSYNHEVNGLVHSSDTSPEPGVKASTNNNYQSSDAQTMAEDVKIINESRMGPANPFLGKPPISVDSFGGSRRGWPLSFKKSRTLRVAHMDMKGGENSSKVIGRDNFDGMDGGNDVGKVKKKILKTLTPTSEQLASLNLKEGKNTVVFTFSTARLGKQQVDARIFLWRWDTRIVISDVDGTITRSDLLGQVMPLVGMDWSQTGVAHLFSAIKENGYQLLFLSARSISQSFRTRQFLCNIRQDGKCLPDGPVVISPDGLFPSLYREVVRRTPHEFKISCLEDIKALFPPDRNPFYAGFGNRDTDEFSYLKVGIPRGKIFTINPKGEIVVNHHVDTKSYLSLHSLVHGMFPTKSSEQEDYNSWNYWKLPPPPIDL